MGQWTNSWICFLRAEYVTYGIDDETTRKIDFDAGCNFSDVDSDFRFISAPARAWEFHFTKWKTSDLTDYQLLAGVRFLNLWEGGGLVAETGIKGAVNLISSGELTAYFNHGRQLLL